MMSAPHRLEEDRMLPDLPKGLGQHVPMVVRR
ncbi:hypothetical protein HNQ07_004783 [Deinococcus metalli]|uniref:Uncharacterized protein n=1 Tax=Deinococcus metalli TaxID=1141878 RepID=A0A7W8KL43_9DEIO|nr:hypothetical protein [Deinococcus metalli]